MALYRLEFLISSDVDVTNGTTTVTLNDGQDVSSVVPGTAVFINNQVVEAISGQNISPTQSTITLRYNWPFATVTAGRLVAFNTFEGLNTAITRLNDVISSVPDFTGATGQGLLYNDGTDTYSIKPSTIFGESLLNAADASEASTLLQSPDYPSLSGQAGILKKDALDVYSLVTSTAFGESLLSQADAASTRSTIGVNSATDLAEGLIRKQTQAEALAGIDDSGSMSSKKVHEAFNQYGYGKVKIIALTDLNNFFIDGTYYCDGCSNTPDGINGYLRVKLSSVSDTSFVSQEYTTAFGFKFERVRVSAVWGDWYRIHSDRDRLNANKLQSYTISTLPSASANLSAQIFVSDLAGQAAPCYSDGTNWRRNSDNTIAS